jgi:hypothetical protein
MKKQARRLNPRIARRLRLTDQISLGPSEDADQTIGGSLCTLRSFRGCLSCEAFGENPELVSGFVCALRQYGRMPQVAFMASPWSQPNHIAVVSWWSADLDVV